MSAMDQALQELQVHVQANPVHPQGVDFGAIAAQQVAQLGDNPSFAQYATYMTSLHMKSDHESKQSRGAMHKVAMATSAAVHINTRDIVHLKNIVSDTSTKYNQVQTDQYNLSNSMAEIKATADKSLKLAAENRQRNSKGNIIVSGDSIPRHHPYENLYDIVSSLIYQKYGIWIYYQEMTALHRLPNNRVFFSLFSRLPGSTFQQLVNFMNSSPKSDIKVFVCIQLFEPFSELYYIARKLKQSRVITNYRLDENGHTSIALSMNTQSFRFTGLDQLQALRVLIPPQLVEEINQRKEFIKRNEAQSSQFNSEKAYKERPNLPTRGPPNAQAAGDQPRGTPTQGSSPHGGPAQGGPTHGGPPPRQGVPVHPSRQSPHSTSAAPAALARPQGGPRPMAAPTNQIRDPRLANPQARFPFPNVPPPNHPPHPQYSPPVMDQEPPPPGVSPVQGAGHSQHHQRLQQQGQSGTGPGRNVQENMFIHTDPRSHVVKRPFYETLN